jgi:hypothetical protein
LLTLLLAGCGKEPAANPSLKENNPTPTAARSEPKSGDEITQATPDAPTPKSSPNDAPPRQVARTKKSGTPLKGRVDPVMTARLKMFIEVKKRMPSSLLELSGTMDDSMPRPAAGFVYAIDSVTEEVKLVPE